MITYLLMKLVSVIAPAAGMFIGLSIAEKIIDWRCKRIEREIFPGLHRKDQAKA